ncbi:MAG: MFS transporter [Deltaproteobacteria bacterium]|nr:MFS transporter [Deltaproteobacteria bacterium]
MRKFMADLGAPNAAKLGQERGGALAVLDGLPVNRFHWRLVFLSGLGWMFDGLDTILLSLALPALMLGWKLSATQVGLVGTVDRLGALCGAALAGLLADRYGRRALFQATLLIYSFGTGLLALAANLPSFLLIRFFVGLGLGGELPVVVTLVTEWVPARQQFLELWLDTGGAGGISDYSFIWMAGGFPGGRASRPVCLCLAPGCS